MKTVFQQLRSFIADSSVGYILAVSAWVTAIIFINFYFDFQETWIYQYQGAEAFQRQSAVYFLAYGVPIFLFVLIKNQWKLLCNVWLWVLMIIAPLGFGLTSVYDFIDFLEVNSTNANTLRMWYKMSFWISQVVVVFVLSTVVWFFKDKKRMQLYGFEWKNLPLKPYWIMLAIMIVPIFIAGCTPEFQSMYPRMQSILGPLYPLPTYLDRIIYELAYGINFLGVEIFFRGFLVGSMVNILGKNAILPMASFYVAIHFGKPLGECISSYFGGALLGVISYHSNSIKGGLLVHVGIAWMMEIAGGVGNIFSF